MADGRCLNADILTTTLLANNEGFARNMVRLSQEKNAVKQLAGDTARGKAQIKQIDMQIQSMLEARILYGDAGDLAKQTLIKRLKARGGTIGAGIRALEMIDSISVRNMEEYAELLGKNKGDVVNTEKAINDLKNAVSDFVAAKNGLKVNYGTKVFNKNLAPEERKKALGDWWKKEVKIVKEGGTPTNIVSPDDTWKHIVRTAGGDQKRRERLFNNWLLGRIFLGEDEDVVKDFINIAKDFDNTLPTLTVDDINSFDSINTLINRVYTNTYDIATNPELRQAIKLKIVQLMSGNKDIPLALIGDAMTISNIVELAEAGTSFTTVLKYNNVGKAVRSILIDESGKQRVPSEYTSEQLFKELKELLESPGLSKRLVGRDGGKQISAFGTKINGEELLKIIYAASWDSEVKSAIELHEHISDDIIISFAKARLFGLDAKNGEKNLRDLIKNFTKPYSPEEVSTISFVATSGIPVKPSNGSKIAFVHMDDANNLTLEDDALMSRAKFNDDLASVNTLTVTTNSIATYDITNGVDNVPTDLEYIVIANGNLANNRRVLELKARLEKEGKNKNFIVVFPRSRQSGQYFVDTDGKLKFKTTNNELFNEMSDAIAINSFNNATIDLAENTAENRVWTQLSLQEKKNNLNNSAVNFFKHFLGTEGEGLSNKQVIQKVAEMTGVPLKLEGGNSPEAWETAQRMLLLNYTMSGKYTKEILSDSARQTIIEDIMGMSTENLIKEVNKLGFNVNVQNASKNIDSIRQALINMRTTDSLIEYIWNKGVIWGLSNKGTVTDLTVEQFKNIIVSDKPLESLSSLFFGGRRTTKKEVEAMTQYLSDITDALISDFMTRLTRDGYQLPLISPRKAFVAYLKGELSVTDEFIQAFAFKNGIDEDYNLIRQIFDDHMPSEIIVDNIISPETLSELRGPNKGLVVRELDADERFLPVTYNSYYAVMGRMDIPPQTAPRQVVRITADEVKDVLRRFFTDEELEGVSVNFYDNLINGIGEGRYSREGMQRALDFINNPEEVTPYHESVHMYIDMFLTKEQRENFLNEIYQKNKKAISKFIMDNGYEVDDALAAAEEWVAENFIKFVKNKDGVRLNKETRNWFQRILDMITSFFRRIPEEKLDSLNQFYSDIYNRVRPEGGIVNRNDAISVNRNAVTRDGKNIKYNPKGVYKKNNTDNVEWVPIEYLDNIKEFDRRSVGKLGDSNEVIDNLKKSILKDGITSYVTIYYDPIMGKAYIAEGNHRLAAAKELGLDVFPATVKLVDIPATRERVTKVKGGFRVPGKGKYDNVAPSSVFIEGDASLFGRQYDSLGNVLTNNQISHFNESKARDRYGNLQVFYHGTFDDFDSFDFDKIGENGVAKGPGFYFTTSRDLSDDFGGKTIEAYLDVKNPYIEGVTEDKGLDVRQRICDKLIEKGYIREDGIDVINSRMRGRGNFSTAGDNVRAADIFNYLINKKGVNREFMEILEDELGYDAFVTLTSNGDWGVVATFRTNQMKKVSNKKPMDSGFMSYRLTQQVNGTMGNSTLTEDGVIQNILTKYEESVAKHIKDKTMTAKVAQDLKQQASYALNIAVQDLILSKYGSLLSASDREGLLGMGYGLKLASNTAELNALKQANAEALGRFRTRWGELAQKHNKLFSNTEELNKQLMDTGKVYTQRDGMESVVDVWDELENSIRSIPDNAGEFAGLKTLTRESIKGLAPRDAYVMLKIIDLVKNNITRGNFYTQLMYQLNPQLRKAINGLDFFQSYKAVDVGGGVWVPWSLTSNTTNGAVEVGKAVDDAADIAYKADITKAIYENYIRVGKELSQENLEEIVRNTLKGTIDEDYAQHYIDSFAPYVSLKGLSNDVKTYIKEVLNQESADIQKLLQEAGADLNGILNSTVALDDGSVVAIKDIVNGNVDGWQERLFGGLSRNGEELFANTQKGRNIQEELKGAYAWFNDVALITDNESKSIIQILGHARKILQRDTNTQKFVEFDNAIGGQNDILKGLMEYHVFGQWQGGKDSKWVNKFVKTWARRTIAALGGYSRGFFNKDLWNDVKKMYEVYYSKSLRELNGIATPNDGAHQVALELAKYFKQLEQRLGSKNGATGVSAISSVNIAFGNLGNIVRNVNSAEGVYSLMNKIGNNQVLGLFKFTKEGDSSYNEFLHNLATNKTSKKWAISTLDSKSVEIIQGERDEIAKKFNNMFNSNFSEGDVNVILQGLGGYQIINTTAGKVLNKINSYIGTAGRFTRMLMSYPFQLFTVYPQLFAYNVKSDAFKKALGVENLSPIKDVRKKYGILEGTYVELNPIDEMKAGVNRFKQIIGRDSDELKNVDVELDDGVLGLYGKTTSHIEKKYTVPQKIALFDSVRDNANNLIDASQAQTFKGLAFIKALQKNDYITFMNAEAFDAFMQRSDIAQNVKDRLLDRVNVYANRIFNNMLGTGFSGLDKAYGKGAVSDFFMGVLQTINFKGAWGTNIFRQTFEKIGTLLKVGWNYAKGNREVAEDIWRYAVNTPEWTNFTEALWGDLIWSWKMAKYAKNGQIPDDESEVEMMDYISWMYDNIELVSQQWQGLLSFGGMRPFTSAISAVYGTRDKGFESLGYGAGAFINTFVSNIGRGWKPWNLGVEALMVAERDGIGAGWDYLRENFYTLSAGTMRYMIEEGYNAYGANTALTNQRGGIPAFMLGNQYEGSDTAFSYKVRQYQTWDYLKNFFDKDEGEYARSELVSSAINLSQFFKLGVNAVKSAVGLGANIIGADIPDWAKSKKGVYSLLDIQEDFSKSPTFQTFLNTGKAMPPDIKKRDKLIDLYTNANYPGGYKAYEGLQNFKNTGHINGNKDKGYYYDEGLEEFYSKINAKEPKEIQNTMDIYAINYLGDPDSEEGRQFLYNWAVSWLDTMTDDPNYNVYASALYKGNLNNLYYEIADNEARKLTDIRKAMGFSSSQAKVSRSDMLKIDDIKDSINRQFLNNYYDQMYRADAELMQNQIYQWIAEELEPEVANGYFTQQNVVNYAGNETDEKEWVLNNNIKSQLKDFIEVEKAIDEGRWEDAVTKGAILTQALNYDDEMGLIRASAVDFYADRIVNSDWYPTVKQSALAWLIDANEDVFKYDSELAEKYGEAYDAAVEYKNEVLHNISLCEINGLNDLALILHTLGEDESSSKKTASNGVRLSSKLSNLIGNLSSSPSAGKSKGGTVNPKWAAIPIKGLSAMGYKSPTKPANFNFEAVYKSKGYDPKTKTLGPITPPKKNKAIKSKSTRKMTQKEENELDLI